MDFVHHGIDGSPSWVRIWPLRALGLKWETDQQAEDDHAHCRKVAMQESDGQRSVDPFKESVVEENCMKRIGYQYVKSESTRSSW